MTTTIAAAKRLYLMQVATLPPMTIFGHDGKQWRTLKMIPNYYE